MRIVYASTSAVVGQTLIRAGTHWPADDPIVKANPSIFSDDPRWGLSFSVEPEELTLETTTAAPGEKRAYVRRG